MAPNVLHIGVTEQVSIAIFDAGNPVNVKLYLQDFPHRRKTFSQVQGRVDQGDAIFSYFSFLFLPFSFSHPLGINATWVGVMQEDNSKTDHIPGRIIPVTYFVLYFLLPRKQHISSSEGT